jgi:hypothetical protein
MACGAFIDSGLGEKLNSFCLLRPKSRPGLGVSGLWRTPPVKEGVLCTFRVSAATFVLKARSRKTQADLAVVGGVIRFSVYQFEISNSKREVKLLDCKQM